MNKISDFKIGDKVWVLDAPDSADKNILGKTGTVTKIFKGVGLLLVNMGINLGSWYLSPNEIKTTE